MVNIRCTVHNTECVKLCLGISVIRCLCILFHTGDELTVSTRKSAEVVYEEDDVRRKLNGVVGILMQFFPSDPQEFGKAVEC